MSISHKVVKKYEYLPDDSPYPSIVTVRSIPSNGDIKQTRTEYKRERSYNIISDHEVKTEIFSSNGKTHSNVISDRIHEWGWRKKDNGYTRVTSHGVELYIVDGLNGSTTSKGKDTQFSYSFNDEGNIAEYNVFVSLSQLNRKTVSTVKYDTIGRRISHVYHSTYKYNGQRLKHSTMREYKYLEIDSHGNWTLRESCFKRVEINNAGVENSEFEGCDWIRREIQYW